MRFNKIDTMTALPNLKYVYPFQRARFIAHWRRQLPIRNSLQYEEIINGFVLPPIRHGKSSRWMGYGGIVDNDGNFVQLSAMCGENGSQSMGMSYTFDKTNCIKLSGEYLYLGFFIKHWGHFIIDSSTRIYFALKDKNLKCFFILRKGQKIDPFPSQIDRALVLAGIRDRVIFISEPTQIEKIIIPEQSYVSQSYYSSEYIETFNLMSRNVEPSNETPYKKVFFSRSNFNKYRKCEIGNEIIDGLFTNDDYKIVYPESESLDNQVFYLNCCTEWGTIAGSLVHNLMFTINPPKTKIVNKSSYINLEDMDTCKIKNVVPEYLDFFISRSPTHHYWGPFIFFPNYNMQYYINAHHLCDKCRSMLNVEKYKYLLNSFNFLFHELWPNPNVNFEMDSDPSKPNYFPPELVLDWAKNYSRLEHDSYLENNLYNNDN